MERTKVNKGEGDLEGNKEALTIETPTVTKMRWKKVGGGSLRLANRIIKPGQVFVAAPEDIPKAFRDLVVSVSGSFDFEKKEKEIPPVIGVKPIYTLALKGASQFLYNVIDAQGKVLNEKGLKKEVAEKLIADLSK